MLRLRRSRRAGCTRPACLRPQGANARRAAAAPFFAFRHENPAKILLCRKVNDPIPHPFPAAAFSVPPFKSFQMEQANKKSTHKGCGDRSEPPDRI